MSRPTLGILFAVVLFSVPLTYYVFLSEPIGVPMGGYDPAYIKQASLNKIIGKSMLFVELLILVFIYYKLQRRV
jgi:hypothetical protein